MICIVRGDVAGGWATTDVNGRRLSWVDQGDLGGAPVLLFHGAPGLTRVRDVDDEVAAGLGVRLITVHRPGYAGSDPAPGRRVVDWAADVRALCDALALERVGVLGWSNGGSHALACAFAMPERLTGVAVVSGFAPCDGPAFSCDMARETRLLYGAGRRAPWSLGPALWMWGEAMRRRPEQLYARMNGDVCATQAAMASDPAFRAQLLGDFVADARRHGLGLRGDVLAHTRPWGFEPADVRPLVHLWHGERDNLVPVSHGRRLADALPDCRPTFLADEGHEVLFTHLAEILSAIRP